MLVAQNFLTVKMAGWSFGRKQNYGLTVTVSSEGWCGGEAPASVVVAAPCRGADMTSDGVGATMRGRLRWRGRSLAVTGDTLGLSKEE